MRTLTTPQIEALRNLARLMRAGFRRVLVRVPGPVLVARIFPAADVVAAAKNCEPWALWVLEGFAVHGDGMLHPFSHPNRRGQLPSSGPSPEKKTE